MRYLGGKMRQSKKIVEAIRTLRPDFSHYVEPFCGAMWSACAVIKAFPGRKYALNDANPYLMRFWKAAVEEGWEPPMTPTESEWNHYKKHKPLNDPMSGYLGFAWSFGGKFFGGAARQSIGGEFKGSYSSTLSKLRSLRGASVFLSCGDFRNVKIPLGGVVYLDPPYASRTPQSKTTTFDQDAFFKYAEDASDRALVLTTEFLNPRGWPVLHNYGDTVVRHWSGKPPDGTCELLMRVERTRTVVSVGDKGGLFDV